MCQRCLWPGARELSAALREFWNFKEGSMPLLLLLPLPEAPGPLLCICKAPPSFKISFKVTSSLKAPRRPSIKSKLPRTPTALHLELMDKLMLSLGSSCLSSQVTGGGSVRAFCLPGI